jgi:hypothetical protein
MIMDVNNVYEDVRHVHHLQSVFNVWTLKKESFIVNHTFE